VTSCKNCLSPVNSLFCSLCGQKSTTQRLSFFLLLWDFVSNLLNTDQGLLRTLKDLSLRPHQMIDQYLKGKRQHYTSASKFVVLMVIVFTVQLTFLEQNKGFFKKLVSEVDKLSLAQDKNKFAIYNQEGKKGVERWSKEFKEIKPEKKLEIKFDYFGQNIDKNVSSAELFDFFKVIIPAYHNFLFGYLKYFIIIWIPIFSFFSYFFFFKAPYNWAEHLCLNSYIFGYFLFLLNILSPFYWSKTYGFLSFKSGIGLGLVYLFAAYNLFFKEVHRSVIRSMICLPVAILTYVMVLTIVLSLFVVQIAVENMDFL